MINTFRSGIQCIDNGTEVDFSSCFEYDSDNDDSDGESYDGIESTSSTISHNFLEEDKEMQSSFTSDAKSLSFEVSIDSGEESTSGKITQLNCCASGSYCRCPWIPTNQAHTCSECNGEIHSFCFGYNEEGSKSKCSLCVFPNGVCEHSMGFNPPPPPPSVVPSCPPSPSESSSIMLDRSIFLPATKLVQETSNLSIEDTTSENNNMELATLVNNYSDVESIENKDVNPQYPASLYPSLLESSSHSNVSLLEDLQQIKSNVSKEENINDTSSDMESVEKKEFEDMNKAELKIEFRKRNMKIGRITRKETFINKLHEYENNNEE